MEDVGFRAALEWMPDAVVIVGRTGRIVEANARAEGLFGRRREHSPNIEAPGIGNDHKIG